MNDQTQTNQADLNKSQQPEQGAEKQAQADQTVNQAKANPEEKTFQADQTQDQAQQPTQDSAAQQAGQYSKDDQGGATAETEIDDEETDTQSETSNS